MGQVRRLRRLAYLLVIVVVLAGVGVGLIFVTHPRDEDAFLAYYAEYDREAAKHPERLLESGDAGCDWLNDQVPVVFQPTTQVGDYDLVRRYEPEDANARRDARRDTSLARRDAAVAFDTLCGGTHLLIQITHPWEPFTSPGD